MSIHKGRAINLDSLMPKPSIYQNRRQDKQGERNPFEGFFNILSEALSKVNNLQNEAEILTQGLVTGEIDNIHEVMIAAQKAEIALELTLEIRNKILAAYDKIMMMR